jgi:hypothetical protein
MTLTQNSCGFYSTSVFVKDASLMIEIQPDFDLISNWLKEIFSNSP